MKITSLLIFFCSILNTLKGQEAVYFFADDGLKIRGDLYLHNLPGRPESSQQPFIILCHQDGSNRSEFYEIAPRLLNLNYNCLAIDLRAGGNTGFIQNETANQALLEKRAVRPIDAASDIIAAIRYVQHISRLPVILLGSSYSASLCLIAAAGNPMVKAVIALSPGEYFQPQLIVGKEICKIHQQVFVSATSTEFPYLQKMMSGMPPERLTLFKPQKGKGIRGTGAFYVSNENNAEYWFALMMFFKKLG